jgi:hypothetical protein
MKTKLVGSTRPGAWIYEIEFDGYHGGRPERRQ